MKKGILWLLAIVFAFQFKISAQEKLLTVQDASWMNYKLFPANVEQLQWLGSSDAYVFADGNRIMRYNAKNRKSSILFTLDSLNKVVAGAGIDTLKKLPPMRFSTNTQARFSIKGVYYLYNFKNDSLNEIVQIPDTAKNIDIQKKSKNIAYTINNNLFIGTKDDNIQITHDINRGIVNGKSVHRNEFGIIKGTFWSQGGNKLAFYRKDETMVANYPLVDIDQRIAKVRNIKYPMAGMTSQEVTLAVYDLQKQTTIFMKTGVPRDHYLTCITWDPDGKHIYIAILNRDQNHMWLNQYNVETGDFVKTLFEETNPRYVEPEHPLYFNPANPKQFIWMSRRNGFNHLYLYNTNGHLIKQLTNGKWVVTSFNGFRMKNKVFFTATKASPLQQNLYWVDLRNGKIIRVTPDHGQHRTSICKSGKYIIDIYSNTKTSREYKLLNYKGKTINIIKNDKHPLKDYKLGKMSIFKLKADNGDDLYCRMIKPVNFDSTKKYPVIVYVYGGPHVQLITDSWLGGTGFFLNYLAENGYLIFTLDNHGSANRGRDFEQVIYRHLGTREIEDQMTGVRYLKSLPYVDSTRLGVYGWSFGGFMTTSLMVRKPGVFKVGVGGGPVIDWKYYEVMYGERYMDTPQENPKGYKEASTLTYINNLKGHLLLIHGTMDPTVVWQNSLMFIEKAIEANKLMDYFVYPGQKHGIRGKGRIHLNRKIKAYFDDYL